jgi:hypothetical protein
VDADDERDPLDRWLSQQAQPLPPPPGTFELITRRARRRKVRKLAVTLVSAAAVAAAVAVAVPVGLNLHLTSPPTGGTNVADGGHSSSPGTQSPNGNGTPDKTSSPSASATRSATAPSSLTHPVPANFQPTSVTFVSSQAAWVIGQAGTPGTCANKDAYICTSIARTNDAGQTWQGGPAPDTTGPNGATGVSAVRFLNATYGWAFGPELWATSDGGTTWSKVDTGAARVTDLETSGGRAYALWANGCSTPSGASPAASAAAFAAGCTSYTLMTATAGSADWTPVGKATSGLTNGGAPTSAVLALTGSNGYLLAPDGALYSGSIGGAWSQAGTSACEPGTAQADGLPSAAQLALVSSSRLWIACNGTSAGSPPVMHESDNGGSTWTQPAAASWSGVDVGGVGRTTSLAAAPDGTLTLATTSGIYYLPSNGERWQPSNATGGGAPAGGFSYVGMTTDDQGVAVPADTSLHEIWMTSDGGASWAPATSITPGH